MDIDVKTSKYLLYKVYKWWYCWMIFSNDRSIYVENNERDGIWYKGKWEWMENGHFPRVNMWVD